jgi:phosphopantetheine--protein transferase-like protein
MYADQAGCTLVRLEACISSLKADPHSNKIPLSIVGGRMPSKDSMSVGIDLVSVSRVESILDRWGDRFLNRIFTRAEVDYCISRHCPASSLAARFAAKEAFFKAVSGGSPGQSVAGIRFKDVEVVMEANGAPRLKPSGAARDALGESLVSVSLSHEKDMAVAIVVTSPVFKSPEVSG